jgi:hypothetical protein
MASQAPAEPPDYDPKTVVGLIFRIVDEPRRAVTFVSALLPILAMAIQLGAARTTIMKIPSPVIWWGGTAVWEACWCTGRRVARRRRRRTEVPPSDEDQKVSGSLPPVVAGLGAAPVDELLTEALGGAPTDRAAELIVGDCQA